MDEQMLGRRPSRLISHLWFTLEKLARTGLLFEDTNEISSQNFFRVRKTKLDFVRRGSLSTAQRVRRSTIEEVGNDYET
jgi:hypothetical protein